MQAHTKLLTAGLIVVSGIGTAWLVCAPAGPAPTTVADNPAEDAGSATSGPALTWSDERFGPVALPTAVPEPHDPVPPTGATVRASEPTSTWGEDDDEYEQPRRRFAQADPWSRRRDEFESYVVRPQTHVVRDGDTLEGLAEYYLGDPERAIDIFEENRHLLPSPHLLPIGAELSLPPGGPASVSPRGGTDGLEPIERPGLSGSNLRFH